MNEFSYFSRGQPSFLLVTFDIKFFCCRSLGFYFTNWCSRDFLNEPLDRPLKKFKIRMLAAISHTGTYRVTHRDFVYLQWQEISGKVLISKLTNSNIRWAFGPFYLATLKIYFLSTLQPAVDFRQARLNPGKTPRLASAHRRGISENFYFLLKL